MNKSSIITLATVALWTAVLVGWHLCNHGFSRTIPAISDDGLVVTIGPEGHVMCCQGETGELLWTSDFLVALRLIGIIRS